ncbi:quinone-dependent dihydroorotate dehydrogenase [Patescibacteria group bacterium]|nr:quinone-dependent dihydroorotate dehydrogenase [Patescibacteria group bacterium]
MPEIYKGLISPVLDGLSSETWHVRTREALHWTERLPFTLKVLEQLAYGRKRFSDERLRVVLGGVEFDNPVMVGAGWDKAGRAVKGLHTLGFSGVEVGSVLAYPQPGNPKPRQFMIGPGVSLNRLGFNSSGDEVVARNLRRYRGSGIPIGVSIAKNKEIPDKAAPEMHALVAKHLYKDAFYFVINVSSPNTPGLRALQDKAPLTDIAQAVNHAMDEMGRRKPLFVKIAPELSNEAVDDVIEVVINNGLTGIIATNTTVNSGLKANYGEKWRNEAGGLAGDDPEYRRMATEKIAHIYREAGDRLEIVGVGGVKDGPTALEKIMAGARVVQVVTGIRGEGTTMPGRTNRGIVDFMDREGVKDLSELVGIDAKDY